MRRAAVAPYFSTKRIADLEPFIQRRIDLLCDSLRWQSQHGPVEVHTLFLAFANDTVCSYAFNYTMNLLEDPKRAKDWQGTISAVASLTPLIKQFPWLTPLAKLVPLSILQLVMPNMARLLSLHVVSV